MKPLQANDPRRIGPFTVVRRLGSGGMGMVYLGKLPSGKLAAIKLIHPHFAADKNFRERFVREVNAAKAVGGFFNAPIVDADPHAAIPWLATAYIDGPTLDDAVTKSGPLSPETTTTVMLAMAEALIAIHHARLIHRDLKPSNIILAPDGPRVIDFGIARALDDLRITDYGAVVGTADYMSPEQARGDEELTPASDVFSLGAVLVFASSGHPPFHGGHFFATIQNIANTAPDLTGVAPTLAPTIAACLEKDPADRPKLATLLSATSQEPTPQQPAPNVRRDRWWLRQQGMM
jgi:serine/threonine protein kinase